MNFLEELAAEWYTYRGYFVLRNIKFGRLPKGGWEGEIDVAAFNPKTREFVHIEPSTDADSWEKRRKRFGRKFDDARKHYDDLFPFEKKAVSCIAIVSFSSEAKASKLGPGIEVKSIPQFIREVSGGLSQRSPFNNAVPEGLPLLRAMQLALHWGAKKRTRHG